ncbi:MAG: YraN family protein [Clostridiales Family XIII bacterium]|jgi:putative endonuclease|nr:YraN family protein [Clostridiales Family XIII bacterium]
MNARNDRAHKRLGRDGEAAAAAYLTRNGYRIIAENYRCKIGEIDLIAKKGNTICFVEVKSRRNLSYGRPCESVGVKKQQHIRRTASYFLMKEWKGLGADCSTGFRFDVAEVIFGETGAETAQIDYIEDAFR